MLLLPAMAMSQNIPDAHTVDSLRSELSHARTASDSVTILCNLYDVLPRDASTALGDTLIHTAMRAGDQRTALDIIRNQANRRKRDADYLDQLTKWTKECNDGNDRRETLTFIRLMTNLRRTRYSDSVERKHALQTYLEEIEKAPQSDLYDHIALTHGICLILSEDPSGDILVAYMDSLGKLINKLPA